MPQESKNKIKNILNKILSGYCLGKEYNYCLEYSVKGLLNNVELNESELLSIMEHLDEKGIILSYIESGSDDIIKEETYKVYFPDDFKIRANQYLSELSGSINKGFSNGISLDPKMTEIVLGKLISYSDGSITYDDKLLDLRSQTKVLCRLFMNNFNKLVLIDDIKDEIINANKREIVPNETISKYVSDLHCVLRKAYKKDVLFNQKKEGWIFNPEKDIGS